MAGRKSKYETHVLPKFFLIGCWARDGLTDEQIAKNLGIAYSTFKEYKNKYSAFSAILKKGKEIVDFEVENSLLKRAMGYTYDEVTQESVLNPDTMERTLQVTKIVKKEVQPDVTAQIFWLKNRKRAEWRDKIDMEHSGEVNFVKIVDDI